MSTLGSTVREVPAYAAFADAAIGVALDEAAPSALEAARAELERDSESVLHTLCTNVRADGPARELLALLVACELDPVRAARIGVLIGATRPSRITLGAAVRLLGGTAACAAAIGSSSPLRRAALVSTGHDRPWASTEIVLAQQVLWALMGDPAPDSDLPVGTTSTERPADRPRTSVVTLVSGPDRVRRRELSMQRSGGGRFLVSRVPSSPEGWAALVREASVTGRTPVVELEEGLPEEGRRWIELATHLGWALTSVDELPVRSLPDRDRAEYVAPDHLVSEAEWQAALGPDVPLEHRLTAAQTELVASVYPTVGDDVHVAVRRLLAGPLGTLTRRVRPRKSWDDLVLAEGKVAQLRAIVARYQNSDLVLDDWGLAHASGRGIVSLFTGQSGTGKTLAAEVIASALGLDLYRIDVSSVVSKYIGETEQNLEKLFQAASAGNSVLFFDEADSLFGKRAEVKDSRDRYANLEVSYLLQRLESYDGVVVLATNLPKNIDEAFLRRIQVVVDFPQPGTAERRAIWERHLSADIPTGELDLDLLASRYELSGGIIRNAIVGAAFQAAGEEAPLEMRHLLTALMAEHRKLGRIVKEEDFRGIR